jgi:hypothetical protein
MIQKGFMTTEERLAEKFDNLRPDIDVYIDGWKHVFSLIEY